MEARQETLDIQRLEKLADELVKAGALAGLLRGDDNTAQGLAFLLQDPRADQIKDLLERVDLTLTLSPDSLETLRCLKALVSENQRLKELSVSDGLTGLYNHRYFQERLEVELKRVNRTEKPCSLIMIDLDRFKHVNDLHGHQQGDELLKAMADIIRRGIRAVDMPARYGGDEFAVILPDTGLTAALALAERIRGLIAEDPRTARYGVTGSIGLATHQHYDQEEARDLIERADQALYQAKRLGGDRTWFFESDQVKEKPTEVTVSERDSLFTALSENVE
ncbi:MAG: GGDEF domain-containing protein [Thermodesulfobacteriota bacterium]